MEKRRPGLGLTDTFGRKAHCQNLLDYHNWRQQKIVELLEKVEPEVFKKTIDGSFSSLYVVLDHLIWAEKVWFSRVDGTGLAVMREHRNVKSRLIEWTNITHKWTELVESKDEAGFAEIIHYKSTKGQPYSDSFFDLIVHVIDHSTYHIGQMMNAIRAFEIEPVPTNYYHYLREKKK